MRIYDGQTTNVTEANATAFRLDGFEGSTLVVKGTTGGAKVTLLVNSEDNGVFVPIRDPYGIQVGIFNDVLGAMAIDSSYAPLGKVIIDDATGSTDLTVDYGTP